MAMEKLAEKYGIKKEQAAGLAIVLALEVIATLITIVVVGMMLSEPGPMLGTSLIVLALCLLVGYYTLIGYRKPHGNLLRYTMLAFAFLLLICMVSLAKTPSPINMMLNLSAALLMAYMAGRLNKYDKNRVLIIIILILLAFNVFIPSSAPEMNQGANSLRGSLLGITVVVLWVALSCVYALRFKDHKDAGEGKD